ncbi:phage tail family protein [Klebsiella oxytoca]|uniref:host specificity protein J n=1 Tax=Klebsiella oxytoca TaxID=571 RepID=UPI000D526324|nr:phage tail protein [Klebsiella oxytoca]AWF34023.1 phage tail family protein [Klebsiella oxytoca]
MQKLISGRKGGGGGGHTPVESPDDLQSVAKAKMLVALGEGEFYGQLTGKQIFLDGTPLESDDGTQNFAGVKWEFRPGTQDQKYIPGMPGTENEISLNNVELKSGKPWVRTITNTTLSALRFRFKWPSLITQHDNGDVTGAKVNYKIEIQTDGGAWETFIETAVDGKTTSGYERSHRVTLPEAKTSWTVRITKTSEDNSSLKVSDTMNLESYTEVIDVKLRYPNTALLYIEFDASQFNGEIPPVTCEPYGRIVRVPDNYDPQARTYNGAWGGAFKWAWTNNPAWIFYDIIVEGRFGLGRNIKPENISKWHLYTIARYCDELVPDGKGGDGKEPRYLCDVYIQERNAAYNFVRDFSAIFGGMVCWSGEQILVTADMPRDVDYNFTRANTVGQPRYSSTTAKDRYTNALVSWSDPANGYSEAVQPAFVTEYVARYDFQQVEVTAIGCTRQSEAYRRGLWAIYTNNRDRVIDIDVGMDGKIPQPGYIFSYADERLAGRVIGGRISAVNGRVITLDRDIPAEAGDRLQINLPSGLSQARTIQSINGKRQVTVTTEYSETPEAQAVWLVEYSDLYAQQYRTLSVKNNNDGTYTISGIFHDPDKYKRIDSGAIIDGRPISVLPGATQAAPENITIKSTFVINQGIRIESMQVDWDMAKGAVSYEAQWRRNNDNWINIPRSSTTGFEVNGIYAGQYSVRVRAINASGVSSSWGYAPVTTLNGKTGSPLAPVDFATNSILHGVSLSWEFPEDSGDTLKTEIEYSTDEAGKDARLLSDVAYPAKTYEQLGLSIGATFYYRARLVDRSGNASRFTDWIIGQSSTDLDEYYKELDEAIKGTEAFEKLQEDIEKGHQELVDEAQKIRDELAAEVDEVNSHVDSTVKELKDSVTQQIKEGTDNLQNQINQSKEDIEQAQTDIGTANKTIEQQQKDTQSALEQVNKDIKAGDEANQKAIKTAENQLKQAIEQSNSGWKDAVEAEAQSRIDDVNSAAQKAADQLLNEKRDREAAITGLQQIVQEGDDSLARQIAEISAGSGQQFDSFKIYHFDKSAQGWTEDDAGNVVIPVTSEGWLKPANSTATCISPNGQAIPATAYRTVMMRVKRVGNPEWSGLFSWIGADETGWSNQRSMSIAAPEFDSNGVTVVMLADIPWNSSETIRRYKVAFTKKQDSNNYFLVNWVSVARQPDFKRQL